MKNLRPSLVFALLISTLSSYVWGQEIERDLRIVPTKHGRNYSEIYSNRGGSPPMTLPFLDDFAWPSFFEESGADRPELVRWDSSPVRRTNTFSINTPTIGVATLDGLNAGGYPYQFNAIDAHGWADTLTSRQLILGGMTADDGVTLSFWVQGGGIGNGPDEGEDSLIVEFKSIGIDGDVWTRVWETPGFESETFTQVVIPIEDGIHMHNSFQFRFRNYGTLMANADLWHIDYVYVATNGATGNPVEELAFSEPAYSLLRSFSAIPWTHFSDNPEFYMRDTLHLESNNFGTGPNNQENTGIKVRLKAPGIEAEEFTNEFIQNVSVPVGPFSTEFLSELLDESGTQSDFVYDTSLSDSIATFEVSIWEEEVGYYTNQTAVFDNDSIGFDQVFDNYYAYDDGTAEKAYALDAVGGQLAVRFPLAIPDTLDGVLIHFTPFYDNAEEETFVLKVWEDDGGMPGDPIDTMYQFHNPYYFTEGHDMFAYYPMDHPVPVSGTIHVGLIQQSIERLNIGLDKNTNSNSGNLHYMLGPGYSWALSGVEGSLMLRPVLRSGKELIVDIDEVVNIEESSLISSPYPNPTSSVLNFNSDEELDFIIFDSLGKVVFEGVSNKGENSINVEYLENGIYILQARNGKSRAVTNSRFVIQR